MTVRHCSPAKKHPLLLNINGMFQFEMPKVVHVKNKSIGLLYRILQLIMTVYFLGFVIWWSKGYQQFDEALSGVMVQVHGIAAPVFGRVNRHVIIMDSAEYMLQPTQRSGFFIITRISNYTIQHFDRCVEARDLADAHCSEDAHCPRGETGGQSVRSPTGSLPTNWIVDVMADAHGIFTGTCRTALHTCEIYGWCPVQEDLDTLHAGRFRAERNLLPKLGDVELDHISGRARALGGDDEDLFHNRFQYMQNLKHHKYVNNDKEQFEPMLDVLNFIVFIKNSIEFPHFNVALQNLLSWQNETYLRTCRYSPTDDLDKYCPNFRISDILELSGADPYRLLKHGGVIAVTINWNCDFDWSVDKCMPVYDFLNLDGEPDEFDEAMDIPGMDEGQSMEVTRHLGNFEEAPAGPRRLLIKVNGIQFIIRVTGIAGKFNLFIFTMHFGSNLALLSLASLICDYFLFHCTAQRRRYSRSAHIALTAADIRKGRLSTPDLRLEI